MFNPKTAKTIYWSFWSLPLLLYLVGLIGHWPEWIERLLLWSGFPWSLATLDISVRLETIWQFGWAVFFAQIGLFVVAPAILDYFLFFSPLLKLWQRRQGRERKPSSV